MSQEEASSNSNKEKGYHSSFNDANGEKTCGIVVLPLKTKTRGPAPPCPADSTDIVDEAIDLFRANVLFRSYKVQGSADRILCYLTVYIRELLELFGKHNEKSAGKSAVTTMSVKKDFAIPGDSGFCLPGFFDAAANSSERTLFASYFLQLRQETAERMVDCAYNEDGSQNKWWIQFAKRKFMNVART